MCIQSPHISLSLNPQKGLRLETLAFKSHNMTPLIGTLPQGTFDNITQSVDYSSFCVELADYQTLHQLSDTAYSTTPHYQESTDYITLCSTINTPLGTITKHIHLHKTEERVRFEIHIEKALYGDCKIHAATLLPDVWDKHTGFLETHNGGEMLEHFPLNQPAQHTAPVSAFITATTALGATKGLVRLGDAKKHLTLTWNPAQVAMLPMLEHHAGLTRLFLSLSVLDETRKAETTLLPCIYEISGQSIKIDKRKQVKLEHALAYQEN